MSQSDPISQWGIFKLYSAALKNESWIEAICLGYTMLEIQLRYFGTAKRHPQREIERCEYLLELAGMIRTAGLLPEGVFREIETFNLTRKRAIHRLATSGDVTLAELRAAAESVGPIYGEIQDLWMSFEMGPERWID